MARQETPSLLRRVETRLCTVKTVRIIVVIKFIVALVTCVIVCSQIIDNTEYLISHYCMLNYFEKKFRGQEDVIELQGGAGITFCHSSVALDFSPEEMRTAVNTSAGLLTALCLMTCSVTPVTLAGLRRCRPPLVIAWFVVTACRATVVTVAAGVFMALDWSRFTAMTRHPVALFMTHVGCALLDVLTDLPVLMLYRSMKAGASGPQREAEEAEEETQFTGEEVTASGGGESAAVSPGSDATVKDKLAVPTAVGLSVEGEDTPSNEVSEAALECGNEGLAKAEAAFPQNKKTSPKDMGVTTNDKDIIAVPKVKHCITSEGARKRTPQEEEDAKTDDGHITISETETNTASETKPNDSSEQEESALLGGKDRKAPSDRRRGSAEASGQSPEEAQPKGDNERPEYAGTVFIFHDA